MTLGTYGIHDSSIYCSFHLDLITKIGSQSYNKEKVKRKGEEPPKSQCLPFKEQPTTTNLFKVSFLLLIFGCLEVKEKKLKTLSGADGTLGEKVPKNKKEKKSKKKSKEGEDGGSKPTKQKKSEAEGGDKKTEKVTPT